VSFRDLRIKNYRVAKINLKLILVLNQLRF